VAIAEEGGKVGKFERGKVGTRQLTVGRSTWGDVEKVDCAGANYFLPMQPAENLSVLIGGPALDLIEGRP
jgi:hypothetical protein